MKVHRCDNVLYIYICIGSVTSTDISIFWRVFGAYFNVIGGINSNVRSFRF